MANTFVRFLSFALLFAFSASCSHEELDRPDSESEEMSFQVENGKTRGFIDGTNVNTIGTSLTVYGYLNDKPFWEGTSMAMQGKNLEYAVVDGEVRWIIKVGDTPVKYYWNENGTYKFFGWLRHDQASGLSIPATWTFDESSQKLNISATVDKNYNQFDFIYSDIHIRELNKNSTTEVKQTPVPFELRHLFASFGVGIRNSLQHDEGTTNGDVTITQVRLEGIHDIGSAVIDYSGDVSGVTYNETQKNDSDGPFIEYKNETGYVLPAEVGVVGDAFSGSKEKIYYMVWPQDKEIVSPTNLISDEDDEEKYEATDSLLVVTFKRDNKVYTKRIKFPEMDWEAGKRYHFELQIADKQVELTAKVNPWSYSSSSIDFTEQSIAIMDNGLLEWDDETCIIDNEGKKVYVSQGQPIVASFGLVAPQGGQWRVSLEGDVSAFKILDDAAPVEDGIGPIDGQTHLIRIVPQISNPERQYTATLKFVVLTADGKVLPADDLIQDKDADKQPDKYTIVIQGNK